MQALVKTGPGPGLSLETVPDPVVGINDVLVRVLRTGICGTDLHIASWDAWAAKTIVPPLVVGHEFVGEVVEVGANVSGFAAGDLVSGEGHVVCGRCRHCLAGRRELCANTVGLGVARSGAFAEYVVLPMTNVWHHWPGIDVEVAAVFDPFGNAVHTALAFPVLGEDVLISGAGPIGLMATAVARHAGARYIVVSEPNRFRRDLAIRMGASLVVDPTERGLDEVQAELGMVEGFDICFEMSGSAVALRSAIANAENNNNLAADSLTVKSAIIENGPVLKRFKAGARGTAMPRRRKNNAPVEKNPGAYARPCAISATSAMPSVYSSRVPAVAARLNAATMSLSCRGPQPWSGPSTE